MTQVHRVRALALSSPDEAEASARELLAQRPDFPERWRVERLIALQLPAERALPWARACMTHLRARRAETASSTLPAGARPAQRDEERQGLLLLIRSLQRVGEGEEARSLFAEPRTRSLLREKDLRSLEALLESSPVDIR